MARVHEVYVLPGTSGEVVAALKQSAVEERWKIGEESASAFFAYGQYWPLWWLLGGGGARLLVEAVESDGRTSVRFTGWGYGTDHDDIWRLLVESGLSRQQEFDSAASSSRGSGSAFDDGDRSAGAPSWVTWARVGQWAPWALALPFLALAIWLGSPYAYGLAVLWWVFLLSSFVAAEFAARGRLRIGSRGGIALYQAVRICWVVAAMGILFAIEQCA